MVAVTTPAPRPGAVLRGAAAAIAVCSVAAPALIVWHAPRVAHRAVRLPPRRVVPRAELPQVEPVAFADLDPDDARAFNASVPFVDGPNPAARPFRLAGDTGERARATDCMAAAVLYEAGDDAVGERAVAQVVVNRVRHPAFPKTICGVVFQGSERTTGCQFTFTCDGALVRHHWSDAQWERARTIAAQALGGRVFRRVGYATHYHTDWVVPYWQSSLDKIAGVGTHLFFRWTGWWGTPPAFDRHVSSDEPVIAALALYSPAHRAAVPGEAALPSVPGDPAAPGATGITGAISVSLPLTVINDGNTFFVAFDTKALAPDGFPALAERTCGERPYCRVMGWTDRTKVGATLPLAPAQVAALSFSYLRDRALGFERALWSCAEFHRPDPAQCMKPQLPAAAHGAESVRPDVSPERPRATVPDGLDGVRRRTDPASPPKPVAPPTAAP